MSRSKRAASGLGVEQGPLLDQIDCIDFAEGVGKKGLGVDFAKDTAACVGVRFSVNSLDNLSHRNVRNGIVSGVAEYELAATALSALYVGIARYVDELRWGVESDAVSAGRELEVEGV